MPPPPQEPTHFDADPVLIQEDMAVMSDFELHRLCQLYSSLDKYQLDKDLLLDSGKFHLLQTLLATLKTKVMRGRGGGRIEEGGPCFSSG